MRALRSSVLLAWAAAVVAGLGGCGSQDPDELPPAAEPPRSPALTTTPEGRVTSVGARPEGIVADPGSGLLAVSLRGRPELAIVRASTGKVVRRVSLPGAARHLQLAGGGTPEARVLVPDEAGNELLQVAIGGRYEGREVPVGRVVARARTGRQPHDATPLGDGAEVAVGAEAGDLLQIVRGDRVVRQRRIALQPGGLATLDGGRVIAVVSVRERVLELYDARTLERLASAPAGVGPTHVVCRTQTLCYVADTTGQSVLVFRWQDGELDLTRRQYLTSEPYGLALDEQRDRLWVTLPAQNRVVDLIAGAKTKPLRTVATVRQSESVAVDPTDGHVVVTGLDAGVLQSVPPLTAARR
ncbi:YncE family protein [Patulibacter sp. NPDC049589]|uniref:YncE family protein n=1 Tax=Patulibacter sp. NPDC049589 TaxID=3154731 RepID=UPI003442FF3F